jgi:shikimate kinase
MAGSRPLDDDASESSDAHDPQDQNSDTIRHQGNGKDLASAVTVALGSTSLVLVGLMGAGKTTVGRRLASRLDIHFVDADIEIEKAAGSSIADIFKEFGEEHFRDGEQRVIARLLDSGPQVLATGGGAYMNEKTRQIVEQKGISIWLKADLDVLMKRVSRRSHRPLLQNDDPEAVMKRLMDERYPIYAQSALSIDSKEGPHEAVVDDIIEALFKHLGCDTTPLQDSEANT